MTANKSPPNYPKAEGIGLFQPQSLFDRSIHIRTSIGFLHPLHRNRESHSWRRCINSASAENRYEYDTPKFHHRRVHFPDGPPVKLSELRHFSGPECSNHFPTWNLSRQSVDDDLTRESARSRTTQLPDQATEDKMTKETAPPWTLTQSKEGPDRM